MGSTVPADQESSSKGFCCPIFPLVHRDPEECAGAALHPETHRGLPGCPGTTGQCAEALCASRKGKELKLRRETGSVCTCSKLASKADQLGPKKPETI